MTDDPAPRGPAAPEAPVPKLPRGRGIRLSGPQLMRIAGTAIALFVLLVMQKPCARAVSNFVASFDDRSGARQGAPRSGSSASGSAAAPAPDYEHLRPGMTDEEIKATIERARAKADHPAAPPAPPPAASPGSPGAAEH
jgi:hypothetical protein